MNSNMKIKGLTIFLILFLVPFWSCEKKGEIIELYCNETGCANPWNVSINDPNYKEKVLKYLEQQNINVKKISITNDGPWSGCFACSCTTGRKIYITIREIDKTRAINIDFYLKY